MADLLAYLGLFAAALGAATIVPMQSEAVLVGLLLSGKFSTFWLLAVASLGVATQALAADSHDVEAQRRLWTISEQFTGVSYPIATPAA